MTLRWEDLVIDAVDPVGLGTWWADALGWSVFDHRPADFEIRRPDGRRPGIIFEPVAGQTIHVRRQRLVLRSDQPTADVRRLVKAGAVERVGPFGSTEHLLADPEGNEFWVLPG